jgi:stage II sporulation protein D
VAARLSLLGLLLALSAGCMGPKKVTTDARPLGPVPAPADGPVLVRVGLAENLAKQRVTCDGPWHLASGKLGRKVLDLTPGDTVSTWHLQNKVMYASDLQGGIMDWIILASDDPDHVLRWDDRPWRGELHFVPTPQDSVGMSLINVLELESYLAGVVPGEIGRGRPATDLAAVEAQAIAARTYTAAHLDGRGDRGFDVYADTRDQVYGGVAVEDSLCTAAVTATAGLVLRREGELVDTIYHSTCGGHTASAHEIWPVDPDPVLQGRADRRPDGNPWCAASKYLQWRQQWTWSELTRVLQRTLPAYLDIVAAPARAAWAADAFSPAIGGADGRDPGALHDLAIRSRTSEGRVDVLEITTDAGLYRVRGDRTRWVLRPPSGHPALLRSAWFDLEVDAGRGVTAVGRGWGHGLGLCQMGAVGRARAGQDARGILSYYYPGTRIELLGAVAIP